MVYLVDHDHAGQVDLRGKVPHSVCHGLNAALRVDDDDRSLCRQHRRAAFVNKHVKAGRIHKAYLRPVPFSERHGIGHRHAPGDLFFVVCCHGRAILKARDRRGHLRGLQDCGDQTGLPAMCVSDDGDIPQIAPRVGLHPISLCVEWRCSRCLWKRNRSLNTRTGYSETISESPF